MNYQPQNWTLEILILAGAVALLGILLAWRGLRPRRVGTTPHCATCDYIVGGIETARCPECGADLSADGAIVYGERPIRRRSGGVGIALILVALTLSVLALTPVVRRIDWYQYKPAGWVIDDLKSANADVSDRAWRELERRISEQNLSEARHGQMVEVIPGLIEKDAKIFTTAHGRYVLQRLEKLSPEQRTRLFEGAVAGLDSNVQPIIQESQFLVDRMMKGEMLTAAQRNRIIEMALEHQKTGKSLSTQWLIEHLGDAELASKLSAEQRERFRRQCLDVTAFAVRKTVILGDSVPYQYTMSGRGPDKYHGEGRPTWWTGYKFGRVLIDGKVVSAGSMSGYGSLRFGESTGRSSVPCNNPGRHKLEVELELAVYYGVRGRTFDPAPEHLRWKRDLKLTDDFELLAEAPPGYIKWVTEPSADVLRKVVFPLEVNRRSYGKEGLGVTLKPDNPPVNLGFDVIGRLGGVEHKISTIALPAGTTIPHGFGTFKFPPTPDGKVELILRSSEKAVRETVEMYEAWKGELVFEDVVIKE